MRPQSENKVTVRGKVIGGPDPLVCLPMVAGEKSELLAQAGELMPLAPDLLEWRIDGFDAVEDSTACLDALADLKAAMGQTPLIFTCRIDAEGGFREIPRDKRLKLIIAALKSGGVDLVDIEMCNDPDFVAAVRQTAADSGARLILSYHNFEETPEEAFILDKLAQAQEMGADVAKVAVMPRDYGDVLALLNATWKARSGKVRIPLVTLAMGPEGGITRLAGGLFGSDITFAAGKTISAPGQLPIGDLRQVMAVLYP